MEIVHTARFDTPFGEMLAASTERGFAYLQKCIEVLEANRTYRVKLPCEPQFGKRGLYCSVNRKTVNVEGRLLRNLCAYADGTNDLIDICNLINVPMEDAAATAMTLLKKGVLEELPSAEIENASP